MENILTTTLKLLIALGLFYSCAEKTSHTEDAASIALTYTEEEKEAGQAMATMLRMTPDSLRSPEQKALVRNLEMIAYERVVIKNNRLELSMSKKEFKMMGVPEIYYNMVKKDIESINHYFDTDTSTIFVNLIMDSFKESQREYFAAKGLK